MPFLRFLEMQLRTLDSARICSTFVLMMQGHSLSATLAEDPGLGERFWYWRGASGQRYIHSIYARDLCPQVPLAVFVLVRSSGGVRRAVAVGRFDAAGMMSLPAMAAGPRDEEEIHVHLLAREEEGAERVLRDLQAAMAPPARMAAETRPYTKPVQLDLLAA